MQTQHDFDMNSLVHAGYFPVPGAHLYTALHEVPDPIARVLLVGPFASGRHYSYIPWVRWARYLAARRIECLRYDYRGIGESTGVFEDMSIENWLQDVELLSAWLKGRSPEAPLVLHGLEFGAILAGKTFETGVGDGLLLWAAHPGANQELRATLLRRIGKDHLFRYGSERKPVSDYIHQLEHGDFLQIEEYRWSGKLWRDSFQFELPASMTDPASDTSAGMRPVKHVKADKLAAPLIKGTSVGCEAIFKDFSPQFADSFNWIATAVAVTQGDHSVPSH